MSLLLLILVLVGACGVVFALIRSRPSEEAGASGGEEGVASEHLRLPELALRIHFAELSLDEEIELLRGNSRQLSEWMALLVADKAEEALRQATEVHATHPRSRVATCFLLRAHLAMRDNAGAAKVAQAYFEAMGSADCQSLLQTWHHLRAMNVLPGEETARDVLGLVVEANLPQEGGGPTIPTLLVALLDGGSMLHRGRRMVPEGPDTRPEVQAAAKALVEAAAKVERPAPSARPSAPVAGDKMRFTFLTPGGPSVMEVDIGEVAQNAFLPLSIPFLLASKLVVLKSSGSA
ncbi:hypothetical protein [Myxococcus landrumensis]|uniref:Lipoprotein n=1 Tax=Myxococcus landrumensis TaxID=2813577 RepID=A0ABX7MZB0_9BACT|nr:hypothetical protein [Myxococcus landrumus]QSQ11759.1 hypothetical protein JY572_25600 [Myxococcus landrumus]